MKIKERREIVEFDSSPTLGQIMNYCMLPSIFIALGILIIWMIPTDFPLLSTIKLTFYGIMIILYFLPSILAFDFLSRFDTLGFQEIKRPGRVLILIMNALFAWTIFGWIILICIALKVPKSMQIKTIRSN